MKKAQLLQASLFSIVRTKNKNIKIKKAQPLQKGLFAMAIFLTALGCGKHRLNSFGGVPVPDLKIEAPKIYLSQEEQFIDIKSLNRKNLSLSLSDQIVFEGREEENSSLSSLRDLKSFKDQQDIKLKVSSFCSHTKKESQESGEEAVSNRKAQELASLSIKRSYSVLELIPQELLLNNLDELFYCSFHFSVQNSASDSAYYNISQQPIKTPQIQEGGLSLVESKAGEYFPLSGDAIEEEDIYKILLLNNTALPTDIYTIFCKDSEILKLPAQEGASLSPIFVNLRSYRMEELGQGVKDCRIFSESRARITGFTNSFKLNLDSLNLKAQSIDLEKIENPIIVGDLPGAATINSFFYFPNLSEVIKSKKSYRLFSLKAESRCFDSHPIIKDRVFKEGVKVKTVKFPLREAFPLMALTPRELFTMEYGIKNNYFHYELNRMNKLMGATALCKKNKSCLLDNTPKGQLKKDKEYISKLMNRASPSIHCLYQISIENNHQPEEQIQFQPQRYSIIFTRNAYGVDYFPAPGGKNMFASEEDEYKTDIQSQRSALRRYRVHHKNKPPVLEVEPPPSLEDIYGRSGNLYLSFFDISLDSSPPANSYDLDRIEIECYNKQTKDKPLTLSIPDQDVKGMVSVRRLFSHPEVYQFFKDHPRKEGSCRAFFYEGELLRYFSSLLTVKGLSCSFSNKGC